MPDPVRACVRARRKPCLLTTLELLCVCPPGPCVLITGGGLQVRLGERTPRVAVIRVRRTALRPPSRAGGLRGRGPDRLSESTARRLGFRPAPHGVACRGPAMVLTRIIRWRPDGPDPRAFAIPRRQEGAKRTRRSGRRTQGRAQVRLHSSHTATSTTGTESEQSPKLRLHSEQSPKSRMR